MSGGKVRKESWNLKSSFEFGLFNENVLDFEMKL